MGKEISSLRFKGTEMDIIVDIALVKPCDYAKPLAVAARCSHSLSKRTPIRGTSKPDGRIVLKDLQRRPPTKESVNANRLVRNSAERMTKALRQKNASSRDRNRTCTPVGNMILNHARLPIPPLGHRLRMQAGQGEPCRAAYVNRSNGACKRQISCPAPRRNRAAGGSVPST